MINMSVFHIRDIVKYLVKMSIVIVILFITTKYFVYPQDEGLSQNKMLGWLRDVNLTECLDIMVPGIKIANIEEKEEEDFGGNIEPLRIALELQMKMINKVTTKNVQEKKEQEEVQLGENQEQNTNQENQEEIKQAQTGLDTQVIPNNVLDKFTNSYNGVQIKNSTDYALTEEILKPDITVNNENVLIFHTHTCESYTSSPNYQYTQTGTYRTTDFNYNVVRVGTELENQLKTYGMNVIHDKTYHDYPAYSGSYGRSLTTVENLLSQNPNTDVVIDIHRDAIADYSYAPTVKIGEEEAAQLMFVIGTNGGGLEHPNWQQNLKFAVKIQAKANELYPGLFKSIVLRDTRYNQHVTKGASIIEVGATGNTMEQCLNSMKYLAKVMSEVMK